MTVLNWINKTFGLLTAAEARAQDLGIEVLG